MSAKGMPERDYLGNIVQYCEECEWCQELIDSRGESIFFCTNYESDSYLEQICLLSWCTIEDEDGDAREN